MNKDNIQEWKHKTRVKQISKVNINKSSSTTELKLMENNSS
jgi:hypothetical protein